MKETEMEEMTDRGAGGRGRALAVDRNPRTALRLRREWWRDGVRRTVIYYEKGRRGARDMKERRWSLRRKEEH